MTTPTQALSELSGMQSESITPNKIVEIAREIVSLAPNISDPNLLEVVSRNLIEARTALTQSSLPLFQRKPGADHLFRAGRVHSIECYNSLGLEVRQEVPPIPQELIEQCYKSPVRSMIILDEGYSLNVISEASTRIPQRDNYQLILDEYGQELDFAKESHESPQWLIVPMHTYAGTRGMSPQAALDYMESRTGLIGKIPSPRTLALGILFHKIATGEILFSNDLPITTQPDFAMNPIDYLEDGRYFLDLNADPENVHPIVRDDAALAPEIVW